MRVLNGIPIATRKVWSEDDLHILLKGIEEGKGVEEIKPTLSSLRTYDSIRIQVKGLNRALGISTKKIPWSEDDDLNIILKGIEDGKGAKEIQPTLSSLRTYESILQQMNRLKRERYESQLICTVFY